MKTDFSDLLTLATAADAFARPPLQREAEMPILQREAPYGAPLEPSVVPTPLRTGAIVPGSSLNAPAPLPAQSEAYRSPHGETAAAPHHTLLENAARVIESLAGAFRTTTLAPQTQRPPARIPLPTYRGYADRASATDFLEYLRKFQRRWECLIVKYLGAFCQSRSSTKPPAGSDLLVTNPERSISSEKRSCREFLPADYERRMRRELEQRTQHPVESLLEFVRAMQELFELAEHSAPHAERVERVIRQSHPTFAAYLRGSRFRDLNELASEARRLQGDILAARAYRPPASAVLEPRCAWSGNTPSRAPRRYDSANYAEDRGRDTYAISDRAFDPYSYRTRTSRPTPQFRTTDSRPNEAARQEETRIPQAGRGPNQQPVVFVGRRDRHPARDCPLIIFRTRATVGKLADQGPAVAVRPVTSPKGPRNLAQFAQQVSQGMHYIGSRGIIHRDLAARNVLVDEHGCCKVADFGRSRSIRNSETGVYHQKSKGALPVRWMAPECLYLQVFTFKLDVWAFGILLWEMLTLGSTPYPGLGVQEVIHHVRDGHVMTQPTHCRWAA
ncbi:hypothetical protein HPB47_028061 [Ixodes persulcatus]|uniref:Uncharacterized protein n=1 Tax=Ixodes persulcatus TaxID=34615 RepID=A0AC60PVR5_IXOPE|nr:hypothetical protein HPB47_028061 [Ixodes persulcatus]